MKKLLTVILLTAYLSLGAISYTVAAAAQNDFEIIPKSTSPATVDANVAAVGSQGGNVWDNYNAKANEMAGDVGNQLASGIMTRQTLLDYVVYVVRFLSQIGLVIGVVMIIYAGYLYATTIFGGSGSTKGKAAITNAILGVLVVAFSYAIMKLLTSAFLS